MHQTVERILNGKFDYEKGTLDISTPRIELALTPGEEVTGSFYITGMTGHMTEGKIYSNDIRMRLINDSFSGIHSEIGYAFSAKGLEEGDVVQGEIDIISNQGEYYLPYVATIRHKNIESSLGSIKNLFHFANLAKSNWDEAVKLFYSEDFINLFSGNDLQYKKVYLGLSRFYDNEQNVEEFLLAINKKQPIEYIPEQETLSFYNPEGIVEECINITRNGWGYTVLHVETDADFISFERNTISENEFLGNYISFPIYINSERLHGGSNFAKIHFFNSFVSFTVSVVVNVDVITKPELSKHLEYSHAQIDMMTYYEAFRTRQISADTWLTETGHIVDRMLKVDDKDITARLYKAQLLMTADRFNEAKWILDQAEAEFTERQEFSGSRWAYYLYLTTLYKREEAYTDSITEEVWNLYRNDQTQWLLAWFLLYLSEEFAVSPSKKWLFIEETIGTGCISPMLYVEAVNMLLQNPGLLNKLSDFELKIMRYMVNNNLLTEDIVNQFVYLVSKERAYRKPLVKILKKCYEINPSNEVATVICEQLIKGEQLDEEAHKWYFVAIENELRVTKVYEYFMQSLDMSKDLSIPKMVYLYFSYESELPWEYNAFLYAHAIEDRDEMPDVFESYKPMIERFAVEEIKKGHINRDMALIYRFVLVDFNLTKEMAEKLATLLFVHKISIESNQVSKVVVYQSRESVESIYPVENGVAYIPLYNKDFVIMFEDGFSNRYAKSIEFDLEKLMVPGKLATMILPYISENLEFDVYACECGSGRVDIDEESRVRYQRILDAPEIDADFKSEVREKLVKYYYDNDCIKELDGILDSLNPALMSQNERVEALKYIVVRGMYDKAFDWISEYGLEGVDQKNLVKLCSKLILRNEYVRNFELVSIASAIFFKGKYDEVILKYLIENYEGMTKDMRRIFKAAENFDVEIYSMCERMILQMLYTGYFVSERMDIYKKYVSGGANTDIQAAFLSQCSFDYFVKEQLMEGYVFEELTKSYLRGEPIQTVEKLAYLKYYSETPEGIDDSVRNLIKAYLDELLSMGIYMSFFKNFMENSTAGVNKFTDKTIIEYKTDPGKRVWIHYIIEGDEDVPGEYVTEEMHDMYGGVHAKAFILFFGEKLLYYITEESDGEELLTESASIQKSDISRDIYDSRFNVVNDIIIAKTLQDYDTVDKLLYDYSRQEYVVRKMFKLL